MRDGVTDIYTLLSQSKTKYSRPQAIFALSSLNFEFAKHTNKITLEALPK